MNVTLKHNGHVRVNTRSPKKSVKTVSNPKTPLTIPEKTDKIRSRHNTSLMQQQATTKNRVASLKSGRTRQLLSTKDKINKTKRYNVVSGTNLDNQKIDSIRGIGEGKILVIVANGPSHAEADLPKLKNYSQIDLLSINKPDSRIWPTDYWVFCDNSQSRRHQSLIGQYDGIMINTSAIKNTKQDAVKIKSMHGKGFSNNLTKGVYIGRSSLYVSLQIALWMKYDHIYVFGCDMCAVDGKLYPWGKNPDVADDIRIKRFKNEAENFNWMVDNVDKKTLSRITLCSSYNKWKFAESLNVIDHKTAVDQIIARIKNNNEVKEHDNASA